jgi:predicted Zn finger-like uncharacterized protein
VIITCPECDTRYRYDERRFDGAPSKRVKCTSCGFTFDAANPALAPSPSPIEEESDATDVELTRESGLDLELDMSGVEPPLPSEGDGSDGAQEVDLDEQLPPLPTGQRYSLAVIAGDQAGTVFQISKPRVMLGRGSAMDIQLRDSEVSRRHAALEIRDPEVRIVDLGATNGTWVGGERVRTGELNHQDEFTLGSTTLMLIVTPVRDPR